MLLDKLINQYMDNLSPEVVEVYGGKRVIFVAHKSVKGIFMYSGICHIYPEFAYDQDELMDYINRVIMPGPSERHVILTTSPLLLTNAFAEQVYIWDGDGECENLKPNSFNTFGAEPGRIMLHVFGQSETIGKFSDEILHKWLEKKWNKSNIEQLNWIVDNIGGGWHRARLREELDRILDEMQERKK